MHFFSSVCFKFFEACVVGFLHGERVPFFDMASGLHLQQAFPVALEVLFVENIYL